MRPYTKRMSPPFTMIGSSVAEVEESRNPISHYNDKGEYTKVTDILPLAIGKELKIEGFLVGRWKARWVEGIKAMAAWVISDQVKVKETVVEGFDKMPEAF